MPEITVFSDFVCPWCLIGTRRLDQALRSSGPSEVRIAHKPFLLDPFAAPEGADLRDMLRRKFGGDPEPMFHHIEAAAREAAIDLDFSKVRRAPNTISAHTLVRGAPEDLQDALVHRLFAAYFLEGQDIGEADVLTGIATEYGMSAASSSELLHDEAERRLTRDEALRAAQSGIDGVPHFVFGPRIAFSGAQPLRVFEQAIAAAGAGGAAL